MLLYSTVQSVFDVSSIFLQIIVVAVMVYSLHRLYVPVSFCTANHEPPTPIHAALISTFPLSAAPAKLIDMKKFTFWKNLGAKSSNTAARVFSFQH